MRGCPASRVSRTRPLRLVIDSVTMCTGTRAKATGTGWTVPSRLVVAILPTRASSKRAVSKLTMPRSCWSISERTCSGRWCAPPVVLGSSSTDDESLHRTLARTANRAPPERVVGRLLADAARRGTAGHRGIDVVAGGNSQVSTTPVQPRHSAIHCLAKTSLSRSTATRWESTRSSGGGASNRRSCRRPRRRAIDTAPRRGTRPRTTMLTWPALAGSASSSPSLPCRRALVGATRSRTRF